MIKTWDWMVESKKPALLLHLCTATVTPQPVLMKSSRINDGFYL